MRALLPCLLLLLLATAPATVLAETHLVSIVDFAFDPPALTIAMGDSVHWTNNGAMPHTVTSGDECTADGRFDSGTLQPGDGWGWVFDNPGEYYYYCTFHCPPMEGEVVVQEGTPTQLTTWGAIRGLYR